MLHQDIKPPSPLGPKNQARLHLCLEQSIRDVALLNIPRYFNVIMGRSSKMKWQSCFEKHNVDI